MSAQLMHAYHLTATQFGNLIAYYYYIYTPMQIIVGILFDRFGTRILIALACLVCAIGTYLFSYGDSVTVAMIGRLMVGLGSSFAFVGALKLITIWLPEKHFALGAGIMTALGSLGAITGDVILTDLVERHGWRETSAMAAVAGVILALILVTFLRDAPAEMKKSKTNQIKFSVIFSGLWEALRSRQIWLAGIIGCLLYLPTSAFAELWAIPYLEQAHGFSPKEAASAVSMTFLGWMIGCPIVGFISDFFKNRLLPMFIGGFICLVFLCLFLYAPHLSINTLRLLFILFGMSASVQVIVFAVARESSRTAIGATAIALMNMLVMIGGVVFQPVIGMLLDLHWTGGILANGVRTYTTSSFMFALSVLPIGVVIALITVFFMRETHAELRRD